jgi:hypothetical protein
MDHWQHVGTAWDGEPFQLQGLDVRKLLWMKTNEKPVKVKDPVYGQSFTFRVYEISDGKSSVEFAAGEFSNCCWGFYQRSNCLTKTADSELIRMSLFFTIRSQEMKSLEMLRRLYPYVSVGLGHYEGLRSCFEAIKLTTGKMIDLYDWIEFSGAELNFVEAELAKKKGEIDQEIETIVVKFEAQADQSGSKDDLVFGLSLLEASNMIQRILDLVTVAIVDDRVLVCKGD